MTEVEFDAARRIIGLIMLSGLSLFGLVVLATLAVLLFRIGTWQRIGAGVRDFFANFL